MNNKISTNEILAICFTMSISLFPGFAYLFMLQMGKTTTVITSIIGFLIGLIPIFMIIFINKRMQNQNLFSFNKEKLNIIGQLLNIYLIISAIFICFLNSWNIFDFIISQFLTRNSYYVLAIILCSIIAIAVIKGIETIGRSTFILFIIFIFTILFAWAFLIPNIEIENLKPLFTISKTNFIKNALSYTAYSAIPYIFILGINNTIIDKENYSKKIIISYILSGILVIGIIFLILATFGVNLSTMFTYPEYTLFKSIRNFKFIERIENILSITIFIAYFGNFAYLSYFIKEGILSFIPIKQQKKKNILTYALCILIPITSIYIFKNYNLVNLYKMAPLLIGTTIIPITIIFIRSLFIKKAQ